MELKNMNGKRMDIADIIRQSSPKPNKLVTKMPKTTINWKAKPRTPRIDGVDISPEPSNIIH